MTALHYCIPTNVSIAAAAIMSNRAFRHMRQELGVGSDQYLSSICSGNMNISPTAGRSGALFIVPDGGRVFLKVRHADDVLITESPINSSRRR